MTFKLGSSLVATKQIHTGDTVASAAKGQLTSKELFGVIVWTKKPTIFLKISALASKKRLNQKKIN